MNALKNTTVMEVFYFFTVLDASKIYLRQWIFFVENYRKPQKTGQFYWRELNLEENKQTKKTPLFLIHLSVVTTVQGLSKAFFTLLQQKSEVDPGNCLNLKQQQQQKQKKPFLQPIMIHN